MNNGKYSSFYEMESSPFATGAFGNVYHSKRLSDGKQTVTKCISASQVSSDAWVIDAEGRTLPIEILLARHLSRHPNIIEFLDVFSSLNEYQLVMEHRGVDLYSFLEKYGRVTEDLASFVFQQIASAVEHLHSRHIVHRDIKEENIIIDEKLHCQLIDFGSAAQFGEGIAFSTYHGSPLSASPEVLLGECYLGPPQDVWALGVLLKNLLSSTDTDRLSKICISLLNLMLSVEWRQRPSMTHVLNHEWTRRNVAISEVLEDTGQISSNWCTGPAQNEEICI